MARPREYDGNRVQLVVRIESDLRDEVRAYVADRGISYARLAHLAFREYMERHPNQPAGAPAGAAAVGYDPANGR